MHRQRRAKIIATIGPASREPETIRELFDSGVDVFRLNFSHGSHDDHKKAYAAIRKVEKSVQRPIAVLMDLQGPKLRVGSFEDGGAVLQEGTTFRLDLADVPGDSARATLPHPEIFEVLKPGKTLLIDDGHLRLEVTKCGSDFAETKVIVAGSLSDRKGVNIPDITLPIPALTDKDKEDLAFGLELGVDWVGLSFVQSPKDLLELRALTKGRALIIAKLEKPGALDYLEEIIELADGIMIARGDLGVEVPLERVPVLQKQIIRACRRSGKPAVVATQMLESMTNSPTPTRAEASDVATAVYEGADAVMLSAETATGKFPVRAISIMDRIIAEVEADEDYEQIMESGRSHPEETPADAITSGARQISATLNAAAIVTYTTSGSTTLRAARERPPVMILCITPEERVARGLSLVWGVHAVVDNNFSHANDIGVVAAETAVIEGLAQEGDALVITAGVPFGAVGSTNMIRVLQITAEH